MVVGGMVACFSADTIVERERILFRTYFTIQAWQRVKKTTSPHRPLLLFGTAAFRQEAML